MNAAWLLTAVHAFITCVLVGLIWTIQIVHYPLFSSVESSGFASYEQRHTSRITVLVLPLMVTEVVLAVVLATSPQIAAADTGAAPSWAASAGVALLAIIWGSTALLQVPCHSVLERGFDLEAHRWLVNSNWVRTLAWSTRGFLAMWMLAPAGGQNQHEKVG